MRISDWSSDGALPISGWVPPTLALGLWTLDRREEAVQWYAAAVRTEAMQWRDPANLPALLPDWREEDRAKLAEGAAAWAKPPPSWPRADTTAPVGARAKPAAEHGTPWSKNRKRGAEGKQVSRRVEIGGDRIRKKKKNK